MAQDWMVYKNQGAIRNKPLSSELIAALGPVAQHLGLTMHVISGGQDDERNTGSKRHHHGNAVDADFYLPDGTKLNWNNPDHMPVIKELVQGVKAMGVTGIGAGDDYMGAGRFHMGFGKPAVWGAKGKSANAPEWLTGMWYDDIGDLHYASDGHGHGGTQQAGLSPSQAALFAGLGMDPMTLQNMQDTEKEQAGLMFERLKPDQQASEGMMRMPGTGFALNKAGLGAALMSVGNAFL